MNLILLHPDLRTGYRLARHLHRHSRHHVVAVVQAAQEVSAVRERCGSLSDLQAHWLVCVATGAGLPGLPGLPVISLPTQPIGSEFVRLLDHVDPAATTLNSRAQIYRDRERELNLKYFGEEETELLLLPRLEYYAVLDRIDALQGGSPRAAARGPPKAATSRHPSKGRIPPARSSRP
ncbi:MAG: hypothetical protein RL514_4559 [Verrucomicrobiota bacterium]|jgi:hypothetical protein